MTAALGAFIMHHPDVKDSMEQFMTEHVLHEFASPEPYMRAIVCITCFPMRFMFTNVICRPARYWEPWRSQDFSGKMKM